MRVPCLTGGRGHVICTETIEERVRHRTLDEDLAHVAHVKQSHGAADREMFVDNAGVLEGHLPSAELDEPRPDGAVPFEERSPQRHGARNVRVDESLRSGQSLSGPASWSAGP